MYISATILEIIQFDPGRDAPSQYEINHSEWEQRKWIFSTSFSQFCSPSTKKAYWHALMGPNSAVPAILALISTTK